MPYPITRCSGKTPGCVCHTACVGSGKGVLLLSAESLYPMLVDIKSNDTNQGREETRPGMEKWKSERLGMCTRICTESKFECAKWCSSVSLHVSRSSHKDLCCSWQLQSRALARLLTILVSNFKDLNTSAPTKYPQKLSEAGLVHFLVGSVLFKGRDSLLQMQHSLLHNENKSCWSNGLVYLQGQFFASVLPGLFVLSDTPCLLANEGRLKTEKMGNFRYGSRCNSMPFRSNMICRCLGCCGASQNEEGLNQKPCFCNRYYTDETACDLKKIAHCGWCNSSVFCATDSCQKNLGWFSFSRWSGSTPIFFSGDDVSCIECIGHSCVVPDASRKGRNQKSKAFTEWCFQGSSFRQFFSRHASRSQGTQASTQRRELLINITTKQAEVDTGQASRGSDLVLYIFCGLVAFVVVLGVFYVLYTWLCKQRWRGAHLTRTVHNELQMPDFS